MKTYTSIESFRHVVKYVNKYINKPGVVPPTYTYIGRVKLHGTNAGIRYLDGKYIPQCRSRPLTIEDDNFGFAKFVDNIPTECLDALFGEVFCRFKRIKCLQDFTIFGEWIGNGIQGNNIGIGKLDRQFVIFHG